MEIKKIMYKLRTQHRIYGCHTLWDYNGKCSTPHGHQYEVILEIHKNNLDELNMVYDTHWVKKVFNEYIGTDHLDINDFLGEKNPTMEIMSKCFYEDLKKKILELYSVEVQETPESTAIYTEDE